MILGASLLWLRFEFKRVQQASDLSQWDQIPVLALNGPSNRLPCEQQYPQKKAWFGDLHVHTAASYDATSFGVSTTVDEAYGYARGNSLDVDPLIVQGSRDGSNGNWDFPILWRSKPLRHRGQTGGPASWCKAV